ncbi:MAG: right-handed parallel beta-helix repeat-containing protein [Bacteroidetes bacterium]|nr:right-handed parallel beta-helix repeat-containing protein [Bacteroidota bacterium]
MEDCNQRDQLNENVSRPHVTRRDILTGGFLAGAALLQERLDIFHRPQSGSGFDTAGKTDLVTNSAQFISEAFVDVRNYTSFEAAVKDPRTVGKTLVVSDSLTVASVEVPSSMSLSVLQGGSLTVEQGHVLTIRGAFYAGLYRVFMGDGKVVLGAGSVAEVFPQWWGALGDGTSHDAGPINKAVQSIDAGILRIPHGIYVVEEPIVPKSNIAIVGDGAGAPTYSFKTYIGGQGTLLQPIEGADFAIVENEINPGEDLQYFRLTDIAIDGTRVPGLSSPNNHGIHLKRPERCYIERVQVHFLGGRGIFFENAKNAGGEIHQSYILNCEIYHTLNDGILVDNVTDVVIHGNEVGMAGMPFENNPGAYDGALPAYGIRISNAGSPQVVLNHVWQSGLDNYYMGGSGDAVLAGNISEQSVRHGVTLDTSNSCVVVGNRIRTPQQGGKGPADCVEIVDSDYCVVSGNVCTGGRYGIHVGYSREPKGANNFVASNSCSENSVAPYNWQAGLSPHTSSSQAGNQPNAITASASWKPPRLIHGSTTSFQLQVKGAAIGEITAVGFPLLMGGKPAPLGISITSQVTQPDVVTVTLTNHSGDTIGLDEGLLRVKVWP